jgi:hypothetical protein
MMPLSANALPEWLSESRQSNHSVHMALLEFELSALREYLAPYGWDSSADVNLI